MKTDFKYGLKNASKFLKNFRHNVSENYEEEVEIEVDNINEQTFCDEPNQNNIQLSDILIKKHL